MIAGTVLVFGKLGIRAGDILGKLLMSKGTAFNINSMLDEELILQASDDDLARALAELEDLD